MSLVSYRSSWLTYFLTHVQQCRQKFEFASAGQVISLLHFILRHKVKMKVVTCVAPVNIAVIKYCKSYVFKQQHFHLLTYLIFKGAREMKP